MDSVTLEDWGEEIFAEGVGVKWRKWARGKGERKKKYACPQVLQNPYTRWTWALISAVGCNLILLSKARLIGPLHAIYIGNSIIEYKGTARLLGVTLG